VPTLRIAGSVRPFGWFVLLTGFLAAGYVAFVLWLPLAFSSNS
jgi:DMSO/TMAO reductase YedYZ heme-binding membrane subunit